MTIPGDVVTWFDLSLVHLDDNLIPKAIFNDSEQRTELPESIAEAVLNQFRLHLGWEFLIEVKLFDDHVVVSAEG